MFEPKINPKDFESEMVAWKHKPTCIMAMQLGKSCKIDTLEGTMRGKALDWLVKGTCGEFYIVDDEIFQNIYECQVKRIFETRQAPEKVRPTSDGKYN